MTDGKNQPTLAEKEEYFDQIQRLRSEAERVFIHHFVQSIAPDSTLPHLERRAFAQGEFARRLDNDVLATYRKIAARRLPSGQVEAYLDTFVSWLAVNGRADPALGQAAELDFPGSTQAAGLKNIPGIEYTLKSITSGEHAGFPEIPASPEVEISDEVRLKPPVPDSIPPAPAAAPAKKRGFSVIDGGKAPDRPAAPEKPPGSDGPKKP